MEEARKYSPVTLLVGEDYVQAVDFSAELGGRTITGASHTAWLEWLEEVNTAICPTNPVVAGNTVRLRLTSQEADRGKRWRVYLRATLNSGEAVTHLLQVEVL